jgi:uncharacterized protein (TIGR00299 family) protein
MKIAYFDCFSGVSGDMILGALVDAGLELPKLAARLNQLPIKGFELKAKAARRGHLSGTKVDVVVQAPKQKQWEIKDLENTITRSRLDEAAIKTCRAILERWIKAEIKSHGTARGLRFQGTEAVDLLVDIVGSVVGLALMGIDEVIASPLNLGSGMISHHNTHLPVPAPTTTELVRGFAVYSAGPPHELTTPTGAAIITTLVTKLGALPEMRLQKVGYGAGSREFQTWPNMMRVLIGEPELVEQPDVVTVLETNIDDLNPQVYDHVMDRLFDAGALDVYFTPVTMKKSRPAVVLTVVCEPRQAAALSEIVFRETTTLGIRESELRRRRLPRRETTVETAYGTVRVKTVTQGGGRERRLPEYDDCRRIARETGRPLARVLEELTESLNPRGAQRPPGSLASDEPPGEPRAT